MVMADERVTDLQQSCLRRQLEEVEVIRAMYPAEGEFYMTDSESAAWEFLNTLAEDNTSIPDFLSISFTLRLLGTKVGGCHASVNFSFPRRYPETEVARVTVECRGLISRHQHEIINLGAKAAAQEMVGNEAVLQVVQKVLELAWEMEKLSTSSASASGSPDEGGRSHQSKESRSVHRKLIWFHHIKSSQKRKDIVEWGWELQLGGYCKPGFPGILVFEGEADDVAEYVRRIQSLRWQALQLRGEEKEVLTGSQKVDSIRRFPVGIRELPKSGMSELAQKCQQANLEHLFLTALKISR